MKSLFFTKFPPPFEGMTILSKTFTKLLGESVNIDKIDTSYGEIRPDKPGFGQLKYYVSFAAQLPRLYLKLWECLRTNEYDVLYTVASPSVLGHWRNRLTLEIAQPHVSSILVHVHNGNFPQIFEMFTTARSARRMRRLVDTFVFSDGLLSEQASSYLPSSQRQVVHNTIDEDVRCTDDEVETKIAERPRKRDLSVLYLSNMIKTKGYEDVAEAVVQFNSSGSTQASVDFVGDWPSPTARDQFEARWAPYIGDSAAIQVHGRVEDRSSIRKAMLDADVFVLPTYYPNEAQPVSIVEALNAGTPVIATRHVSIPRYVFHDENGYLVEKKSPNNIARSLQALSDHPNWVEKARAARSTYKRLFSPEAVQQQLLAVFTGQNSQ